MTRWVCNQCDTVRLLIFQCSFLPVLSSYFNAGVFLCISEYCRLVMVAETLSFQPNFSHHSHHCCRRLTNSNSVQYQSHASSTVQSTYSIRRKNVSCSRNTIVYKNNLFRWCQLKQSRYTPWRRMGERRYSSYSYLTSATRWGEWSASRPGRALPPGKGPPVPIG
jgi:hypothetical protein